MAAARIEVEGADELRRKLRELQDAGLKKELKAANKTAAQVVVDRALPNVPVGATGRLKRSVRALGSQRDGRVRAGTARVDYAAAIHWGRKVGNVGSPPGNRMGGNPVTGRPFLWDAAEAAKSQVTDAYAAGIERLFDALRVR